MNKNSYLVPSSIIIAGALIATSLFFSLYKGDNDKEFVSNNDNEIKRKIELREVSKEKDHIRGAENAKITIVEYSDLECPFCKRVHSTIKDLLTLYQKDIRLVYRHFPLEQLHSKAQKEAEATECAYDQGGNNSFWAYVDKIFEITTSNNNLDLNQLPIIALELGLNQTEFNNCLESGKNKEKVEKDIEDAINALAQGTPYFIIIDSKGNKIPVSGAIPIENFKQIIDELL